MNNPKHIFKITFESYFFKTAAEVQSSTFTFGTGRMYSLIHFLFGISEAFVAKVISDPIYKTEAWEYTVEIVEVKYYFLWTCYKTIPYKDYKDGGYTKRTF